MYESNSRVNPNKKTPTNNTHDTSNQNFIDQKNPMNQNHRRRNSLDSRAEVKHTNINTNITPSSQIDVKSIITQVERPNSKTTSSKNKEVIK